MNAMERPSTDNRQRALENLTTAVVILDESLHLVYMNPASEMLFESSARQARNMRLADLLPGSHDFLANLASAMRNRHPFSERELVLQLHGRPVTVDCTVTPLMDPGEEPALMVEMLQVDRQLRISREEHLLAQNQATSLLIRGLAHEIKNPLGGLRGAAQLLERELPEASLKEYTRIIIEEADRLQSLVDRMLGPRTRPQFRAINIHNILEHVRNLVLAEAPKGIKIWRDYDPSIPDLQGDSDLLIQAILNIVRNAAQALGEQGKITLRTRIVRQFTIGQIRHKLALRLDVIDNGPGIPPELQETIFFPMITGRAEGTGLGLSIALNLINQHGGLIECESQPGNTVFTLLLPLEHTHD